MQEDALFDDQKDEQAQDHQEKLQNPNTKTNVIILFVYVLFMFISALLSTYIQQNHITNTKDILDYNLTWQVTETEDGYLLNYQGMITNTSDENVEEAYIVFDIMDSQGNVFTQKSLLIEDLAGSDTININQDYELEEEPFSIDEEPYHPLSVDLSNVFSLLTTLSVAIALFFVNKSNYKYDFKVFMKSPKKYFGFIVIGFILLYAASFTANVIMSFIGVTETSQNEMAIQRLFEPSVISLLSLFLLLVVFTPIVEETVFRKSIYGLSYKTFGDKGAIIISGMVFAFLHVASFGDFIQIIPYAFMGLTFSYIYYRSNRNIYVVIVIHMVNNLIPYLIYSTGILQ